MWREIVEMTVDLVKAIALVMAIFIMLFLALFGGFVLLNLSVTGGWL